MFTLFGTLVLTVAVNLMRYYISPLREGSQSSWYLQPVGIGGIVGEIVYRIQSH